MKSEGSIDPREALVQRLIEVCALDERVVAVLEGGSRARGEADEHSDIDASVIVADDAYAEILDAKAAFVGAITDSLFVEDFGIEHMAFVITQDGVELELHFFRVGELDSIHAGRHRVLLDPRDILQGRTFPPEVPDEAVRMRQLREILMWFWHDLGHFTTAIARGQLWWAAGQLETLRNACINLVRIEQGGEAEDEPYWKLDVELTTAALEPLRPTFVPIERGDLLRAGRDVLTFFRAHGPEVARANGLTYPAELDRLIGGRLDDLT
jgi:predicted nucleotidyltransferase